MADQFTTHVREDQGEEPARQGPARMSYGRKLFSGIIAGSALAVVTLTVFYRLQMFGPTSAINRFNQAAAEWNTQDLGLVTVQTQYNQADFQVVTLAHNMSLNARAIRIVNLEQSGKAAIARVVYEMPNGGSSVMLYVLTESHGIWRIDLDQSMTALIRALG